MPGPSKGQALVRAPDQGKIWTLRGVTLLCSMPLLACKTAKSLAGSLEGTNHPREYLNSIAQPLSLFGEFISLVRESPGSHHGYCWVVLRVGTSFQPETNVETYLIQTHFFYTEEHPLHRIKSTPHFPRSRRGTHRHEHHCHVAQHNAIIQHVLEQTQQQGPGTQMGDSIAADAGTAGTHGMQAASKGGDTAQILIFAKSFQTYFRNKHPAQLTKKAWGKSAGSTYVLHGHVVASPCPNASSIVGTKQVCLCFSVSCCGWLRLP